MLSFKRFYNKNAQLISEGVFSRIQRYKPMFTKIISAHPELDRSITDLIELAIRELRKDHIVSWFLRDIRNSILQSQSNASDYTHTIISSARHRIRNLTHWLSLPIPEIQKFDYGTKSSKDVTDIFEGLENEWSKSKTGWLDVTDELKDGSIKQLMTFPDGFCWMNLSKPYCTDEGEAMGHCGNSASYSSTDTVLSLRKLEKRQSRIFARPSLTFILHDGGILGEMKGRANEKPNPRYHPYILKLLTYRSGGNYLITRVVGGGYKPENNFSLDDLSEENKTELFSIRGDLEPLTMKYERGEKISPEYIKTITKSIIPSLKYIEVRDRSVAIDFASDWSEALDKFIDPPKNLMQYAKIIDGGEDIYNWDFHTGNRQDHIRFLDAAMTKNDKVEAHITELVTQIMTDHPDEYEYPQSTEDIFDLLDSTNDDIIHQIESAIWSGHESGTLSQIYNAFKNGLTDIVGSCVPEDAGYNDSQGATFSLAFQNPESWFDSTMLAVFDYKDFLTILDSGENPWDKYVSHEEGDMSVPYYGYDDYDEEAAIDYFYESM